MNTTANFTRKISTQAPATTAVIMSCTPAQLEDLVNHIQSYGTFLRYFELSLLPQGAQAEMFRCEASLSWILVWFANGWPVMASDYYYGYTYVLDRSLLPEGGQ